MMKNISRWICVCLRFRLCACTLLALAAASPLHADTVTASWNPNPEPDIAGYTLSYGTQPSTYTTTIDVGKVTSRQVSLSPGSRYYFVVKAYNTGGAVSAPSQEAMVDLRVNNLPPTLAVPGNQTSAENNSVSLAVTASDPEGQLLSYDATGLPAALGINRTSGVISGTLTYTSAGSYVVNVTVSDGSASTSGSFNWTVANVNRPPTLVTPANQTSVEKAAVSLAISASDPDGQPLVYGASGLPPSLSMNRSTGVISGTLSDSSAGSYTVTVGVSDGSLSTIRTFGWTVADAPPVPTTRQLEIHYINVGWGNSIFVKGPDGTTVLLEGGSTGRGVSKVVPYLKSAGIQPSNGLDYVIAGHQHCDHVGGLAEVLQAGYNVRRRQFFNGSSSQPGCVAAWNSASAATTAGTPVAMPVGLVIPLGDGARITAVAVAGRVIGGGTVAVSNEDDRSIALLIQHGGFDMLWAGDLGGGSIDQACTGRSTSQADVESAIVQAISPGGAFPLISSGGIDVLHVNHHGDESSTNVNWMNRSEPAVALIGTGSGQAAGLDSPRRDVVEKVLLSTATCIAAPPALVLQSEEGAPAGPETSVMGYSVGDIGIATDGQSVFTVSANGAVTQGPNEVAAAGLPRMFALDDPPSPDVNPPTVSIAAPANGATVAGTVAVTANAADDIGVVRVEFYLDNLLQRVDTAAPWSWSWNSAASANGKHTLFVYAADGAGNLNNSSSVLVTVNNVADTTKPTAPAQLTATSGARGSRAISVNWVASTDNLGVAGYRVFRASASGGPYSQIATTAGTSFADTGLVRGTTYYYYVIAYDAAGNVSAPSNQASARAR
jgi:beta-lactamase superfamily II metal-dependent hydrolase